ncbi:MAG: ParB/RepB/Spo0J family partition protein [Bacillota bacterium]
MSEKRRLGRGLGALIPHTLTDSTDTSEIALNSIEPNPYQPRRHFNEEKLKELAASIKEHGVLQAVVLSPSGEGGKYILVAGERRCRAARIAGLNTVPAVVKSFDKSSLLEIALIENLQREDLNPVEEAQAYKKLMHDYNYTQEELAQRLGRSRSSIANSIRLLSFSDEILEALAEGKITPGQARPLLSINDPKQQQLAAKKIIEGSLSSREAEKMAIRMNYKNNKIKDREEVITEDPLHAEIQLQMQRALGTKVRLKQGKSGGTIEIFYYGEEDLERLIAKLLPEGI